MVYAALATTGVIWGACYLLWMYQKVFYGPMTHEENRALPDIGKREQISLWPLMAMALIMGVASPYWMKTLTRGGPNHTVHQQRSGRQLQCRIADGTNNGLQK